MKLKLNHNYNYNGKSYTKGSIIDVKVDENSIPTIRFWRNLLKDSKVDNCVEILHQAKHNNKKKSK